MHARIVLNALVHYLRALNLTDELCCQAQCSTCIFMTGLLDAIMGSVVFVGTVC